MVWAPFFVAGLYSFLLSGITPLNYAQYVTPWASAVMDENFEVSVRQQTLREGYVEGVLKEIRFVIPTENYDLSMPYGYLPWCFPEPGPIKGLVEWRVRLETVQKMESDIRVSKSGELSFSLFASFGSHPNASRMLRHSDTPFYSTYFLD